MSDRGDQATRFAHLRPLARCRTCGKPATEELYTGLNAQVGCYCTAHAKAALKKFKDRGMV
jgi:hypothetical protein